jgi:hypothetical protein
MKDTIISELRKIRDDHAARFDHDLESIARDIQQQERRTRRKLVSLKPRKVMKAGRTT